MDTYQHKCGISDLPTDSILREYHVGDLFITVQRDIASLDPQPETFALSSKELGERNMLKGITADESVIVHDTPALGTVTVRHCGYTTVVNVKGETKKGTTGIVIDDLPDEGANAFNLKSEKMRSRGSSSGISNSGLRARVVGVPNRCWCGDGIISLTSHSESNPYRQYLRCAYATRL